MRPTIGSILKTLLRHKATYRFLVVLLVALGVSLGDSESSIGQLEVLLCAILSGCS